MFVWADRSSSSHNLVARLALLEPGAVTTIGLSNTVLVLVLVTLIVLAVVLHRVVHVLWVAQAVWLTVGLR